MGLALGEGGLKISAGGQQLIGGDVNAELGGQFGAEGAVQTDHQEQAKAHEEIEPLHLAAHVAALEEALVAPPDGHGDDR